MDHLLDQLESSQTKPESSHTSHTISRSAICMANIGPYLLHASRASNVLLILITPARIAPQQIQPHTVLLFALPHSHKQRLVLKVLRLFFAQVTPNAGDEA